MNMFIWPRHRAAYWIIIKENYSGVLYKPFKYSFYKSCPLIMCFNNITYDKDCKIQLKSDPVQKNKEIAGLNEAYRSYLENSKLLDSQISFNNDEIANFFDLKTENVNRFLSLITSILKKKQLPLFYFTKNMELFKKYNISFQNQDLHKICRAFTFPPIHTETRICMMKEAEIQQTELNITRLPFISKIKMKHLEKLNVIKSSNLPVKIFERLNAPDNILENLPTRQKYLEWNLKKLWWNLYIILLKWKFSIENPDLKMRNIFKIYFSLGNVCGNIDILKNILKFSDSKIFSYHAILVCSTSNLKMYLDSGDAELNYFINLRPDILIRPYEEVKSIQAMLRYIKGGDIRERSYGPIFLMRSHQLLKRLETLIQTTSLIDLRLTPKCYVLIYRMHFCFKKLKENGINLSTIQGFPYLNFLRLKDGQSVNNMNETLSFLKEILNINPSRQDLTKMNMVEFPELICIKKNLIFLLNEGFTIDLLIGSYQVLLFSHDILLENYDKMRTCPYANEFKSNGDIEKLIQLLIYYTSKHYREIGGSI